MPKFLIAILLGLAASGTAYSQAVPVAGQVTKIDVQQAKITLKHEPIPNLDMDSMTMVFTVADAAMLKTVKVGDKVKFEADRVNGKITLTKIEVAK